MPDVATLSRQDVTAGPYRLTVARSIAELAVVRAFRERTYLQRSRLVVDGELDLDRRSVVLGLHHDDELVGCVRVVPLPDDEAGITRFEHPLLAERTAATEVGRLAVAAGRSPLTLLALLGLGSQWMMEHTWHRDYVAFCNAKLVPAYEAVGATDLGIELPRPGTARTYRFVTGRFEDAAERALGAVEGFGARHAHRSLLST